MERSYQRQGLLNSLALLVAGAVGFALARYAGSLAGQIAAAFAGLGWLVTLVAWFQMRLEERERLEKLELEEMARSKGGAALFQAQDAEIFPAQRSRQQFERFFLPAFTVMLFLLQAGGTWLLWRWLDKAVVRIAPERWMMAAAPLAVFFLVLFILGRFSATIVRLEKNRLLRPGTGHLLLVAFLFVLAAAGIGTVAVSTDFPKADLYLARVLCVLLGLIGLETLVNLILEIYRPRVKGKVARPLYESRLVGLLGQPEGLITTAAQALDYQFGFKVSETWFYQFFAKALGWLILIQIGVLLLSTCVVFIEPGELGLLERFGKPVEGRNLLPPGGHLKFPWPMDQVYRHRTDQIQTLTIGIGPEEAGGSNPEGPAVLWTVAHGKEELFLVANRERSALEEDNAGRRAPPVSFVVVNIPVQFQIHDLMAWAYNHADGAALLEDIASREIVRYLVSADLGEIMSHGRTEATEALREHVQAAADDYKLGVNILFVGLQGIHPPVKVAPEYEKVVSALHQKQAKILAAEADAIQTNALAGASSFMTVNTAEADRKRLETTALARAAAFTNQVPAFNAAPSVYRQRAYFQTFARATANARKYILLATNTDDVIQFNLEDSAYKSLLDLSVPAPKK